MFFRILLFYTLSIFYTEHRQICFLNIFEIALLPDLRFVFYLKSINQTKHVFLYSYRKIAVFIYLLYIVF